MGSPDASAIPAGTLTAGVGVFNLAFVVVTGSTPVTAFDTYFPTITGSTTVSVVPGPFSQFKMSATGGSVVSAGTGITMQAQAADANSNNVTGSYSIQLTTSDGAASFIPSAGPILTNSGGQASWTVIFGTTGSQGVTATGAGRTGVFVFTVN